MKSDRVRFEERAVECGCTINVSEPCKLVVTAINGLLITTYLFDEKGNLNGCSTQEN